MTSLPVSNHIVDIKEKKICAGHPSHLVKCNEQSKNFPTCKDVHTCSSIKPFIETYEAQGKIVNNLEKIRVQERNSPKILETETQQMNIATNKPENSKIAKPISLIYLNLKPENQLLKQSKATFIDCNEILQINPKSAQSHQQRDDKHINQEEQSTSTKFLKPTSIMKCTEHSIAQQKTSKKSQCLEIKQGKSIKDKISIRTLPDNKRVNSTIDKTSSSLPMNKPLNVETPVSLVRVSWLLSQEHGGLEYLIQDSSGQLSIINGKDFITRFPSDFAAYSESLMMKFQKKL